MARCPLAGPHGAPGRSGRRLSPRSFMVSVVAAAGTLRSCRPPLSHRVGDRRSSTLYKDRPRRTQSSGLPRKGTRPPLAGGTHRTRHGLPGAPFLCKAKPELRRPGETAGWTHRETPAGGPRPRAAALPPAWPSDADPGEAPGEARPRGGGVAGRGREGLGTRAHGVWRGSRHPRPTVALGGWHSCPMRAGRCRREGVRGPGELKQRDFSSSG